MLANNPVSAALQCGATTKNGQFVRACRGYHQQYGGPSDIDRLRAFGVDAG